MFPFPSFWSLHWSIFAYDRQYILRLRGLSGAASWKLRGRNSEARGRTTTPLSFCAQKANVDEHVKVCCEHDESWQAPAESALPSCPSKTPHLQPIRRCPCPWFPLAVACLSRIWDMVEGGGHRATKTNINTGLWGTAGRDSRAGTLIGVTDRSHNKPYSVFLRSRCLPPGGQQPGGSVLCQCKSLFYIPFCSPRHLSLFLLIRALLEQPDLPASEDPKAYGWVQKTDTCLLRQRRHR